jgi:hypothetical protein
MQQDIRDLRKLNLHHCMKIWKPNKYSIKCYSGLLIRVFERKYKVIEWILGKSILLWKIVIQISVFDPNFYTSNIILSNSFIN